MAEAAEDFDMVAQSPEMEPATPQQPQPNGTAKMSFWPNLNGVASKPAPPATPAAPAGSGSMAVAASGGDADAAAVAAAAAASAAARRAQEESEAATLSALSSLVALTQQMAVDAAQVGCPAAWAREGGETHGCGASLLERLLFF